MADHRARVAEMCHIISHMSFAVACLQVTCGGNSHIQSTYCQMKKLLSVLLSRAQINKLNCSQCCTECVYVMSVK